MVAASSLRGRGAWSPRPGGAFTARKRYALQLKTQANLISRQYGKRKRLAYCNDTESEPRTPKRLCHKVSRFNDENPLGLDIWEESDLEPSHEDMTVEYVRSSEPPTEEMDLSDLSDISPTSPDNDSFEASSASSYEEGGDYDVYEKPDIKRFIEELPSLLKRRYRKSILLQRTHWIDDEPLRVKFLNRQFKHRYAPCPVSTPFTNLCRLHTGDFTDTTISKKCLNNGLFMGRTGTCISRLPKSCPPMKTRIQRTWTWTWLKGLMWNALRRLCLIPTRTRTRMANLCTSRVRFPRS
ncbi:hypothetical protein RSAG8_01938, partial [Rhizoctonia solani AG-8 WAC10335]